MNRAVVTLALGESPMWEITHPLMERYANSVSAEFVKLTGEYRDPPHARSRKFEIRDLLEKEFERVLYLDGDVAVRRGCPDLFELVPKDRIGAEMENPPRFRSREKVFRAACAHYGVPYPEDERPGWFNTGLMVLSRCHRPLFESPPPFKPFGPGWWDMPYLNCMRLKHGFSLYELPPELHYIGGLAWKRGRSFEAYDASVLHATTAMRRKRMWYLREVTALWESGAHTRQPGRAWHALRFRTQAWRRRCYNFQKRWKKRLRRQS